MVSPNGSMSDIILEVSNLTVKIRGQTILDDVSFKLKRGKILAVIGPNGAGKSVLFKTLMNFLPHDGRIVWHGKVKIGYVPQRLSVGDIPISVREFLSFKKAVVKAGCLSADNCLNLVGLDFEELSDKQLGALSGGQLQRTLIAFAVMDLPNVLLFDEPTAGIDLDSEEAIYEMLNRLEKEHEMTILLISHDAHIVRDFSDYMLALNRKVIFFGESKEITNPSLLREIYGSETVLKTRELRV